VASPGRIPARATAFARGPGRRRLYDHAAAINPGFKEYEQKATREIPAVLLERLHPVRRPAAARTGHTRAP